MLAPLLAGGVALLGTYLVYRLTRRERADHVERGFRYGQVVTASLLSLAHGTNDAQKTMGVITLALIAHGSIGADASVPTWVIVAAALAIGAGTYAGGWRVIRTMGTRITTIEPPQGFAADASSAAVILASSHYGFPLSTTHVTSGSIIGSGVGKAARRRALAPRWPPRDRVAHHAPRCRAGRGAPPRGWLRRSAERPECSRWPQSRRSSPRRSTTRPAATASLPTT